MTAPTPAVARAAEELPRVWLGMCTPDTAARAIVSAALHDPDDDVIARTLREHGIRGSSGTGPAPWTSLCWAPGCDWQGDSSGHPAHQADAVRAAILGARGEEVDHG